MRQEWSRRRGRIFDAGVRCDQKRGTKPLSSQVTYKIHELLRAGMFKSLLLSNALCIAFITIHPAAGSSIGVGTWPATPLHCCSACVSPRSPSPSRMPLAPVPLAPLPPSRLTCFTLSSSWHPPSASDQSSRVQVNFYLLFSFSIPIPIPSLSRA